MAGVTTSKPRFSASAEPSSGRVPGGSRQTWALIAVCLGQFVIQLDLTAVNVALPGIGAGLGASTSGLQWVVDAYTLAVASLLLLGGRIGDLTGHKRSYLAGVAVFAAGSGLCAAAPTTGWLIIFRAVQGVGAAIEMPATLAILTHTFTAPRERAQAVGIWAGAAGSSLIVGPVLGGGLVVAFGWRAVFLVNLPIAAAIGALTIRCVTATAGPGSAGLDAPGQLTGSAALALLAAGAIEGGRQGVTSPLALGWFACGTASLATFLAVERRRAAPMLPLSYFRQPAYSAANAAGLVMGFVTVGLLLSGKGNPGQDLLADWGHPAARRPVTGEHSPAGAAHEVADGQGASLTGSRRAGPAPGSVRADSALDEALRQAPDRKSSASSTPAPSSGTPASRRAICTPARAPASERSPRSPRWPIRNARPPSWPRPPPRDRLKRSSAILRTPSASTPSGTRTAVTVGECPAGSRQTVSRPQPRTARRAASACRAWRANTSGSPDSANMARTSRSPYSRLAAGV